MIIVFSLVVFIFIFMPPLASINLIHLLAFFSYLIIVTKQDLRLFILEIFKSSKLLLSAAGASVLTSLLNGTGLSYDLLIMIIEIIPVSSVISYYLDKRKIDICDVVICAGIIQAIISIAAFISPTIQLLLINTMARNGYDADVMGYMSAWRCYGLAKQLTFGMPITQSIIACICLYMGLNKSFKYFIPLPFLVLSSLINARTGFVVFVIGASSIILAGNANRKMNPITLILIGVIGFSLFTAIISRNEETSRWLYEGVFDIVAIAQGKETSDYSYFDSINTRSSYELPSDPLTLVFGSGSRVQGATSGFKTDVGFINDIWFGGILYTILISLFFIKSSFLLFMKSNLYFRRRIIMASASMILLLLLDIKGQVFSWHEFIVLWFFFFCHSKRNVSFR